MATDDNRSDMEVLDSILENVRPRKNTRDGWTDVERCSVDKLPNGHNY